MKIGENPGMKVAIIGAGKMGRWFAKFFLEQNFRVVVSDKNEKTLSEIRGELGAITTSTRNAVETADMVLICVPIENFEAVAKEIHSYLRPNQVLLDICTFKGFPVKIMHKYLKAGITLGTHPLFGDYAKSIKYQNVILTPTNFREEMLAKNFKSWLESRQAKVFIMSPERHDKFIRAVLRLPRIASFILYNTNKKLPPVLSLIYRALSTKETPNAGVRRV